MSTLTTDLEEKKHARSREIFRTALERGELPKGTDVELLHDLVVGALLYLVVFARSSSDSARLERAVRLILDGALGDQGARPRRAASGKARTRQS
jgi:hypothetical protein